MSIPDRFHDAVTELRGERGADPGWLPTVLATACLRVLPAAGAGLSMFTPDGVRVPLGASDDPAALAERLQFTVGQGPCLTAHELGAPQWADEALLERRWPMFWRQLRGRTPFRSILAVPLGRPLERVGTVDLFFHEPDLDGRIDEAEVHAVVGQITADLLGTFAGTSGGTGAAVEDPPWLDDAHSPRRAVFVATGMLSVSLDVTFQDALAVMRAHAFATDTTVDAVATDLVTGVLPVQSVRPESDR